MSRCRTGNDGVRNVRSLPQQPFIQTAEVDDGFEFAFGVVARPGNKLVLNKGTGAAI
jgi:hypothetical protein